MFFLMYIKVFYSVSQQCCLCRVSVCLYFHTEGEKSTSLIVKINLLAALFYSSVFFIVGKELVCITSNSCQQEL